MSSFRINIDIGKRLSFFVSVITSHKEDRILNPLLTHLYCHCENSNLRMKPMCNSSVQKYNLLTQNNLLRLHQHIGLLWPIKT